MKFPNFHSQVSSRQNYQKPTSGGIGSGIPSRQKAKQFRFGIFWEKPLRVSKRCGAQEHQNPQDPLLKIMLPFLAIMKPQNTFQNTGTLCQLWFMRRKVKNSQKEPVITIDWNFLGYVFKLYPAHALMYISTWTVWMPLQKHTPHHWRETTVGLYSNNLAYNYICVHVSI